CHQWLCFVNAPPPTEFYPLSLHDALPIYDVVGDAGQNELVLGRRLDHAALDDEHIGGRGLGELAIAKEDCFHCVRFSRELPQEQDRKSTRLNSSHRTISYAVFCLKKKNTE